MVIKAIDLKDIMHLWPWGRIRCSVLDNKREYSKLAEYLVKETDKTFRLPGAPSRKRWESSKGLVHPKTNAKVVDANAWRKDPKPIKGYYIDPESVRNYRSEVNGAESQFYRLIRIEPSNQQERAQQRRRTKQAQERANAIMRQKKPNENRRC